MPDAIVSHRRRLWPVRHMQVPPPPRQCLEPPRLNPMRSHGLRLLAVTFESEAHVLHRGPRAT